ncbi:MAG: HD domain-containing protein [Candidatus Pacearchaeota archaeon]
MENDSLEARLLKSYEYLEISNEQRESINTYLNLIKYRDIETYEHSIRVGLKGEEVAEFTHIIEPKGLFYPGLLHDVGKALTNPKSLKKKIGFDDKDKKELKKHPIDGYRILRGVHDFSARVLLYHHWFQEHGYPEHIPHPDVDWSKGSEAMIMISARILSVIDFYDAATTRKNDKFVSGVIETPDKDKIKEAILKHNPDQEYLINQLYNQGIF